MPLDVVRDDARRRLVATGRGEFVPAEMLGALSGMRESGTWSYSVLLDLRYMTGKPTIAELAPIMKLGGTPAGESDAVRGPVAIVAVDPVLYGMSCAYAAAAKPPGRVEVFRDMKEAEAWLDARQR